MNNDLVHDIDNDSSFKEALSISMSNTDNDFEDYDATQIQEQIEASVDFVDSIIGI